MPYKSPPLFDLFAPESRPDWEAASDFIRPGQGHRALRKAQKRIDHRLDFHGMSVQEALDTLRQHLDRWPKAHHCLLIHGKSQGRIARALRHFLQNQKRCYGYFVAPEKLGGAGATISRFIAN